MLQLIPTLALFGAVVVEVRGQLCPQRGYVFDPAPSAGGRPALCCPPLPSFPDSVTCSPDNVAFDDGTFGRVCTFSVSGHSITMRPSAPLKMRVSIMGQRGGDGTYLASRSTRGYVTGGPAHAVTATLLVPEFAPRPNIPGYRVFPSFADSWQAPTGISQYGGKPAEGGQASTWSVAVGPSGPIPLLIAGGGGGAGAQSFANGYGGSTAQSTTCFYKQDPAAHDEYSGGGGGGCPAGASGSGGVGGTGGFSGTTDSSSFSDLRISVGTSEAAFKAPTARILCTLVPVNTATVYTSTVFYPISTVTEVTSVPNLFSITYTDTLSVTPSTVTTTARPTTTVPADCTEPRLVYPPACCPTYAAIRHAPVIRSSVPRLAARAFVPSTTTVTAGTPFRSATSPITTTRTTKTGFTVDKSTTFTTTTIATPTVTETIQATVTSRTCSRPLSPLQPSSTCPSGSGSALETQLMQETEKARIKIIQANYPGQQVLVDCGSAGMYFVI